MTLELERVPASSAAGAPRRLTTPDRDALRTYGLLVLSVWITVFCTGWLFPGDPASKATPHPLAGWDQWDAVFFRWIAEYGYFPAPGASPAGDNREAFFPGLPILLRVVHLVVPSWTAAGLVISLVSGAVAVVALGRIADRQCGGTGPRAVRFLLLSPCAVFLVAGYTEMLFLALALPAWLAAKDRRWPLAGVLAALATAVRPSGLFLAAAIVVELVLAAARPRRPRALVQGFAWLMLPILPPAAFTVYLHGHTADWMAWQHAQERGWYRNFHAPWSTWATTWSSAFGNEQTTGYALMFQAELVAVVVGVLLTGWLVRRRRIPEAVYVGLSLAALGTSYWYTSVPRASLLWWPLWVGLAGWVRRRRTVGEVYVCLSAPLMVVLTVTFASGRWAG